MASVDMEDTSFVVDYPPGGVTLEVATPEGTVKISNVSINRVEKVAPRLLDDLADGESGPRIIFSQKESKTCAICLLRYIYRIDYLPPRGLVHVPVSLLLHMQMVTIADRLQLVDLKSQAKRNILEELEYACCVNAAAMDLIEAIHYLVLELDSHEDIQENVAHYCVQNLVYHGLDKLELFRQTVFEAPQFHKLLLKVNIDQGFSAEGAPELINMSTCQHPSHSSEDREIARSASFLCHFHAHLDIVTAERRQQAPQNNDITTLDDFVLVERPLPIPRTKTSIQVIAPTDEHQIEKTQVSKLDAKYGSIWQCRDGFSPESSGFVLVSKHDICDSACTGTINSNARCVDD